MNKSIISTIIVIFTLFSIFPIFFVRLQDIQSSLFWFYSISMTLFLIFMYSSVYMYKNVPDLGFRPYTTVGNILFIGTHPDDVGCGGTVVEHIKNGL